MSNMKHLYQEAWEYQGHRIVNCQSCGFVHLDPVCFDMPLEDFYQNRYYREVKPFPYAEITDEFIERQNKQVEGQTGYQKIYEQVLTLLESDSRSMLDIGCGNDLLSVFFKQKGWETTIIEPNKDAALYLKKYGLSVVNQPVETVSDLKLEGVSFINLQFVLEHIKDPLTVLRMLHRTMTVGGVIRVCVPNDFSPGQLAYIEKYREKPHWVCLPDHINYFTFDSLSKLLCKAGFREVYRTTNFPLEFLLAGGINYYASETERQKVGPFVKNFEASFKETGRQDVLDRLYENLAQQGLGRSIFMYAIKK
ncbi:MAG TPA: class I SAM-dependent methyltransferase [Bacillota bacterium]|nr:class I SAM-dependent methyltransferase [Bacillota bacterium]